jgi:TRAP-type C4-dicarboxylate transport system substrate-binding protein
MWDGYWALANRRAWQALPDDLRIMAARHLDRSALDQRADLGTLNTSLRADLEAQGMLFNDVDKDQFRARLRQAGFYTEWRDRYGAEAWSLLERYAGNLS